MNDEMTNEEPSRSGLSATTVAVLLLTLGVILLVYAAVSRVTAADFLARGEVQQATVVSAEAKGLRFGGWTVRIRFWDRSGEAPPPGRLVMTEITDLLAFSGAGESGDEIRIRWIRESDPPRIAPEASLHESTRPWEQRFSPGAVLLAGGMIASLIAKIQRIRARESRPRFHPS